MTVDLLVGLAGVAIAVGQIVIEKRTKRARMIAYATIAFSVGATLWFFGVYLYEQHKMRTYETAVKEILAPGPATYDDILSRGNFSFELASQAIDNLAVKNEIIAKAEDQQINGARHKVRFFEIRKP